MSTFFITAFWGAVVASFAPDGAVLVVVAVVSALIGDGSDIVCWRCRGRGRGLAWIECESAVVYVDGQSVGEQVPLRGVSWRGVACANVNHNHLQPPARSQPTLALAPPTETRPVQSSPLGVSTGIGGRTYARMHVTCEEKRKSEKNPELRECKLLPYRPMYSTNARLITTLSQRNMDRSLSSVRSMKYDYRLTNS